jgi:3-isopropylmalate dehydratase small subunit
MEKILSGKVWKFGHNIDTDAMAPWKSMSVAWDQRKSSVLQVRPGFSDQVKAGDIIVAGRNWGCGSSREQAAENIKLLGIAAVIAQSFGRIFFRNALAIALPCMVCDDAYEAFEEGDQAEIRLSDSRLSNLTKKTVLKGAPYTPDMLSIIEKGGLMNVLKEWMCRL